MSGDEGQTTFQVSSGTTILELKQIVQGGRSNGAPKFFKGDGDSANEFRDDETLENLGINGTTRNLFCLESPPSLFEQYRGGTLKVPDGFTSNFERIFGIQLANSGEVFNSVAAAQVKAFNCGTTQRSSDEQIRFIVDTQKLFFLAVSMVEQLVPIYCLSINVSAMAKTIRNNLPDGDTGDTGDYVSDLKTFYIQLLLSKDNRIELGAGAGGALEGSIQELLDDGKHARKIIDFMKGSLDPRNLSTQFSRALHIVSANTPYDIVRSLLEGSVSHHRVFSGGALKALTNSMQSVDGQVWDCQRTDMIMSTMVAMADKGCVLPGKLNEVFGLALFHVPEDRAGDMINKLCAGGAEATIHHFKATHPGYNKAKTECAKLLIKNGALDEILSTRETMMLTLEHLQKEAYRSGTSEQLTRYIPEQITRCTLESLRKDRALKPYIIDAIGRIAGTRACIPHKVISDCHALIRKGSLESVVLSSGMPWLAFIIVCGDDRVLKHTRMLKHFEAEAKKAAKIQQPNQPGSVTSFFYHIKLLLGNGNSPSR